MERKEDRPELKIVQECHSAKTLSPLNDRSTIVERKLLVLYMYMYMYICVSTCTYVLDSTVVVHRPSIYIYEPVLC